MTEEFSALLTISHIIYSDKQLDGNAKLILAEIFNLLKVNRYHCWASNDHFSRLLGLKKATVSFHINKLAKLGWITAVAVKDCTMKECTLKSKGWHRHITAGVTLSNILDTLSNTLDSLSSKTGYPIKSTKLISNTVKYTSENNNLNTTPNGVERTFGNGDINDVVAYFKERMQIPKEDCTQRQSRQYWNLLLRESKTGVAGVKWLIDVAQSDDLMRPNITSSRDLYYKRVKLLTRAREGKGVSRYGKHGIDARHVK